MRSLKAYLTPNRILESCDLSAVHFDIHDRPLATMKRKTGDCFIGRWNCFRCYGLTIVTAYFLFVDTPIDGIPDRTGICCQPSLAQFHSFSLFLVVPGEDVICSISTLRKSIGFCTKRDDLINHILNVTHH